MKGFLPSSLLKILITSLNYDCLIDKGPVHPYPNAFENASTRSVCESFSPVHTKTRKLYPLLSMRHATMYVNDVFLVYDIIVFETSIFVRPHENEKPAFSKISTLESVCEKMSFR